MREQFVKIEDYPLYSVSDRGRVRNDRSGRILAMFRNNTNGWYFVTLSKNSRKTTIPVHRLVAEAFLEEQQEPITSILHRDGDRSHNAIENLMWKPRWFVVMYMREMSQEYFHRKDPIYSERYNEPVFESVAHAAYELVMIPSIVYNKIYGNNPTHFPGYGLLASKENFLSYTQQKHSL